MGWAENDKKVFEKVFQGHLRQHEILHADPPCQYREGNRAIAFNLDLTREELAKEIETDPENFMHIYQLAVDNQISYEEAARLRSQQIAEQEKYLDDVSNWHNSRAPNALYPKEPGPTKNFQKFHKRRKGKTMRQVRRMAANFLAQREVNDENLDHRDY